MQRWGNDIEALQRRKHRDRRRDRAIAIDQRSAEQPNGNDKRPGLALDAEQSHEREYSTLAIVVDPHGKTGIFDRSHDDERPYDQ